MWKIFQLFILSFSLVFKSCTVDLRNVCYGFLFLHHKICKTWCLVQKMHLFMIVLEHVDNNHEMFII